MSQLLTTIFLFMQSVSIIALGFAFWHVAGRVELLQSLCMTLDKSNAALVKAFYSWQAGVMVTPYPYATPFNTASPPSPTTLPDKNLTDRYPS